MAPTPTDRDYYRILGVASSATRDEIRAAYRRLVRTNHPDAGGDPAAFALIAEAWEVLSDDDRREIYDHDRKMRLRASRPYARVDSPPASADPATRPPAPAPADTISDAQRWMKNKRRF